MLRRTAELVVDAERLDDARRVLGERLGATARGARVHDRVLLDTFDGRLRAAGVAAEAPAAGEPPPDPRVDAIRAPRALLPVARVRGRVEELAVTNGDDKTVVRIELEVPELVPAAGPRKPLQPRIRVREVLGYARAYERALAALEAAGVAHPASSPVFDEASLAVGRDPAGVSTRVRIPWRPGTRADAAAAALLGELLRVAEAQVPGTLADHDVEFLHDLRVTIRRARSVLRELDGVWPADVRAEARAALRGLQAVTGPVRDLDVQLEDWDGLLAGIPAVRRANLDALHDVLVARRAAALGELRAALTGPRFEAAMGVWHDLAALGPAADGDAGRPLAAVPIAVLAAGRIRRVYRRMVRDGRAIAADSPDEALHDLRKRGKELRYLLELFGDLFPRPVVKTLVAALKDLQDVLGRFQDRAVQAALLEQLGGELQRTVEGRRALMALGLVVEVLHADQQVAREQFEARFGAFASAAQRRLVRDTFAVAGPRA